jgi:hypothetical protein
MEYLTVESIYDSPLSPVPEISYLQIGASVIFIFSHIRTNSERVLLKICRPMIGCLVYPKCYTVFVNKGIRDLIHFFVILNVFKGSYPWFLPSVYKYI